MKHFENDIEFSFYGYDTEAVDEILREKDRLIEVQYNDMESLKREISTLKSKIERSKNKKK